MEALLANKTILIVGAAGGLGQAHARACAAHGANLVLSDPGCNVAGEGESTTPLQELANELQALTAGKPVLHHGRVETSGVTLSLVQQAIDNFGRLDGLIYCAGLDRARPLLALSDADLDAVMQVQALSAMRLSRDAASAMARLGHGGSILLTIGAGALQGAHRRSHAAAADGALSAFVRSAALDLRRHGVRINALSGLACTRTTAHLPMFRNHQGSMSAAHIATVGLFLISTASHDVSGEVVGAAGTRLYGLRMRETAGQLLSDDFDIRAVAHAFGQAIRP